MVGGSRAGEKRAISKESLGMLSVVPLILWLKTIQCFVIVRHAVDQELTQRGEKWFLGLLG